MDLPQLTGDQAAVETVIFSGWIDAKEGHLGLLANKVMSAVFRNARGTFEQSALPPRHYEGAHVQSHFSEIS